MSQKKKIMNELQAMKALTDVLEQVAEEARPRMISWVSAKFNIRSLPQVQFHSPVPAQPKTVIPVKPVTQAVPAKPVPAPAIKFIPTPQAPKAALEKEIESLKDIGKAKGKEIQLLVKDLKASDGKDAAFRAAYLLCYLRLRLLGQFKTPIKEVIDAVKKFKAFDGTTLEYLNNNNFLPREGESIVFSNVLEGLAKTIIEQIRNKDYMGAWKPSISQAKSKEKSPDKNPAKSLAKKKDAARKRSR